VKYAWIDQHQSDYPVAPMCRVLTVSTSGYYGWRRRPPCATQERRATIAQAAARSHRDSRQIYGYRKVHQDLAAAGIACCDETVRRVMRELGLVSRVKRKFVATTDSAHHEPLAPNVLARDFTAEAPNRKWLADITYIPTAQGWLYLAAVLDMFSRRIVGWSMSERIDSNLVVSALAMAVRQRCPEQGLMHHSDRGVQYACGDYQQRLEDVGIVCSMSRRANCWDNAPMESFFGSLKTEWTEGKDYATRAIATQDVFEYIEVFYNRQRRHASLGYVSPAAFERHWSATATPAA
jgi:putative transposase